jgi:hypothetical protein
MKQKTPLEKLDLSQTLRGIYRKEPITAFILLLGGIGVTLGSLDREGSLVLLGLVIVGGALGLRSMKQSVKNDAIRANLERSLPLDQPED